MDRFPKTFLLYPDPWPKRRHHQRRVVTPEFLTPLSRTMSSGAELRLATDIADYVRQTLEEVPRAGFTWQADRPLDWRRPWYDWLSTRYEQKALREGRTPHYLTFFKERIDQTLSLFARFRIGPRQEYLFTVASCAANAIRPIDIPLIVGNAGALRFVRNTWAPERSVFLRRIGCP